MNLCTPEWKMENNIISFETANNVFLELTINNVSDSKLTRTPASATYEVPPLDVLTPCNLGEPTFYFIFIFWSNGEPTFYNVQNYIHYQA